MGILEGFRLGFYKAGGVLLLELSGRLQLLAGSDSILAGAIPRLLLHLLLNRALREDISLLLLEQLLVLLPALDTVHVTVGVPLQEAGLDELLEILA